MVFTQGTSQVPCVFLLELAASLGQCEAVLFKSIKTEAALKHQCWSRERLDTTTELLFYCAKSHYQIITRMLCKSNFFLV